jgi:hypothetical protein
LAIIILRAYKKIHISLKLFIANTNLDIAKTQKLALKVQHQQHSLIPAKLGFKIYAA